LADLTNNGKVDLIDLNFQVEDWLNSNEELPGDLDRNTIVNMSDVALLADDYMKETFWFEP